MKKAIVRFLSLILSLFMVFTAIFTDPSYRSVKAEDIETITMSIGEEYVYELSSDPWNVIVDPSGVVEAKIEWGNTTKIVITALTTGTATVRTTSGNFSCVVKVLGSNIESISISPTSKDLFVGKSYNPEINYYPSTISDDQKGVVWSSSNNAVAAVDENGLVTGVSVGTATITATSAVNDTISASMVVNVVAPFKIDYETLMMGVDLTQQLTIESLTSDKYSDVSWTSSDNTILEVSETGVVIAKDVGNADITATVKIGEVDVSVSINIQVVKPGIGLIPASCSLYIGESVTIEAIKVPDTLEGTIEWRTNNAAVATVENGKITAVAQGNTTVEAFIGEKHVSSVSVEVKKPTLNFNVENVDLNVGNIYTPNLSVTPSSQIDLVEWNSSDDSVVTVDEKGILTANAIGNAVITASLQGVTASFNVSVTENTYNIRAEYYLLVNKNVFSDSWTSDSLTFKSDIVNDKFKYLGSAEKVFAQSQIITNPVNDFELENNETYSVLFGKSAVLHEIKSNQLKTTSSSAITQYIFSSNRVNAGTSTAYTNHENYNNVPKLTVDGQIQGVKVSDIVRIADLYNNPTTTDNTYVIKYIYYFEQTIPVDYYVYDRSGNSHLIQLSNEILSTYNNNTKTIEFSDLTKTTFENISTQLIKYDSVSQTELTAKKVVLKKDGQIVESVGIDSGNNAKIDSVIDSQEDGYTLEVYYYQPEEATSGFIQLPVTMYDFAADGMFFEFCSNSSQDMNLSYGYGLEGKLGGTTWDGRGLAESNMLISTSGIGPRIQYTKATYDHVATLINNGVMWDGVNNSIWGGSANDAQESKDIPTYAATLRTLISSCQGKGGAYENIATYFSDGEITSQDVIDSGYDCYVAAAYMMTHFFDAEDGFGVQVPSDKINSLQLRQVSDGVNSYYVYDSDWNSEVVDGIIQNTLNADGKFTEGYQRGGLAEAYYTPIDWAYENTGETQPNDKDQYPAANFLFSTVGEGSFIYNADKDLYFTFVGDDDVYLYINGKLAVDLGGAHAAESQTVNLNAIAQQLGLEEDEVASFTFFHMERHGTGSHFRMVTNIEITSPSLITNKKAYQEDSTTPIVSGGVVDANSRIEYEFILQNDGTAHMFNLSFWDESLAIGLYPYGARLACRFGIDAKGNKASNPIDPGDIEISISSGSGENISYPNVAIYHFEKNESTNNWWPVHDDNWEFVMNTTGALIDGSQIVDNTTFGQFNHTTIKDKYIELYGHEGKTEQYTALLQMILLNGIEEGYTLSLRGFNIKLGEDQIYTNEVQTYGTDITNKTIVGVGSTTVRTLGVPDSVFVIDFGKPVTYTRDMIFTSAASKSEGAMRKIKINDGTYSEATSNGATVNGVYGSGVYKLDATYGETFTYTLEKFFSGIEQFIFNIIYTDSEQNKVTEDKSVYIIPASTVYYEDDFSNDVIYKPEGTVPTNYYDFDSGIKYYGNWDVNSDEANIGKQNPDIIGADVYGQDSNYSNCSLSSSGSSMIVSFDATQLKPSTATFKFKGTGIEVYSRTNSKTGKVLLHLYKASSVDNWKTTSKLSHFDPQRLTYEINDSYEITYTPPAVYKIIESDNLYKNGDLYQIPVVAARDLPYGEYYAVLEVMNVYDTTAEGGQRKDFYLDAIRISNPLDENMNVTNTVTVEDVYSSDKESKPKFIELRDLLIENGSFNNTGTSGAVYIDWDTTGGKEGASVGEYENYGPKNEIYLKAQQAIGFKLSSTLLKNVTKIEIGLKVPSQDLTDTNNGILVGINNKNALAVDMDTNANSAVLLSSATDMYYDITKIINNTEVDENGAKNVVISNLNTTEYKDDILAITILKLSYGATTSVLEEINLASEITSDESTIQKSTTFFRLARRPYVEDPSVIDPSEDITTPDNEETDGTVTTPDNGEEDTTLTPDNDSSSNEDVENSEDTSTSNNSQQTSNSNIEDNEEVLEDEENEGDNSEGNETIGEDTVVVEDGVGFFEAIWNFICNIFGMILKFFTGW